MINATLNIILFAKKFVEKSPSLSFFCSRVIKLTEVYLS